MLRAQYFYGCDCLTREDPEEAIDYLTLAARRGHDLARFNLALCQLRGLGTRRHVRLAAENMRQVAFRGSHLRARLTWALCLLYGQGVPGHDFKEAVRLLTELAGEGDMDATWYLAHCALNGTGMERDPTAAARHFNTAAKMLHPQATYNLGWMYAHGLGVPCNWAKAIHFYTQAAERGFAQAQNNLGLCYAFGHAVDVNTTRAKEFFELSADGGCIEGEHNLALWHKIATDRRMQSRLKQRAELMASLGSSDRLYDYLSSPLVLMDDFSAVVAHLTFEPFSADASLAELRADEVE